MFLFNSVTFRFNMLIFQGVFRKNGNKNPLRSAEWLILFHRTKAKGCCTIDAAGLANMFLTGERCVHDGILTSIPGHSSIGTFSRGFKPSLKEDPKGEALRPIEICSNFLPQLWYRFFINNLVPYTTSCKWMFGETTIFYVMIWNHPIETTNLYTDVSGSRNEHITLPEANISTENQWLVQMKFPFEMVPFLGNMLVFGG